MYVITLNAIYIEVVTAIDIHAHLMRPTSHFLQHTARITLFTRSNCGLCETAKSVLGNLGKKRSFEYNEVDVMATGQNQWKDLYEFDTPVVSIIEPLSNCLLMWYIGPRSASLPSRLEA